MSIARFSVRNNVLINMVMSVVFIAGIYSMIVMPKEEAPPVDFGFGMIMVMYNGVSAAEMEKQVVEPIEEEIFDVDGIDYIQSSAQEGVAMVFVAFETNVDSDEAWNDLNAEMDKVNDLPDDAEEPMMLQIKMREVNEIANISLMGDYDPIFMREIAKDFQDGLIDIDNISKVDIWGDKERKILIKADPAKLSNYNIALSDIVNLINQRNLNMPGGKIKSGSAELLVRTMGEFESIDEIEDLIVKVDDVGRIIQLSDVAKVEDGYDDILIETRLNGKPDISFQVYKKASGNIIKVMKDVREYAKDFENSLAGITIQVRNDDSIEVKENIYTLGKTMAIGILLVFAILFVFIGWRNAIFAAWGVPFSFFTAFLLMYILDISMNNLSLFALVLVLGMIVDDAIVVIENVYRHMEMGLSPSEAAIKGTNEIMWPVISAVTTTMAAFLPMLIMTGIMGEFLKVFPIVVTLALLASLFESLVILPSHIAEFSSKKPKPKNDKKSRLLIFLQKHYRKFLVFTLKRRFIAVAFVILLLILSGLTVVFKFVKFEFFPQGDPSQINLQIKTPVGFSFEQTKPIVDQLESFLKEDLAQKEDITSVVTYIGWMQENNNSVIDTRVVTLFIELVDSKKRQSTNDQIKNAIREYLESIPMVVFVEFSDAGQGGGPPIANDVELRIKGDNIQKLQQISDIVVSELSQIPGVADAKHDFDYNKKELRIKPYYDRLAIYGYSVSQLSQVVWSAIEGRVAGHFRGDGANEYDIVVRVQGNLMENIEDLQNFKVRSNKGYLIPLKELASFEIVKGASNIKHWNKKRTITTTANTTTYFEDGKRKKRTASEVTELLVGSKVRGVKGIFEDFSNRFPGYTIEFGGIAKEMAESYSSLWIAFVIAALIIFTILSAQFKSYVQPFIVMTTLPFAFIGVIFGLFVTGLPFSIGTFIAVVGLAGVVVNDSLVLVDFVNKLRDEGKDRWNSLIIAGETRLRPIILTTVTTIFGFMPMIVSTSEAARDWKSIAVSMAFGLAFATFMTLIIIPCIYSIVDSIFGKLKMTRFKDHISLTDALALSKEREEV